MIMHVAKGQILVLKNKFTENGKRKTNDRSCNGFDFQGFFQFSIGHQN
jgi:hypothetical protein